MDTLRIKVAGLVMALLIVSSSLFAQITVEIPVGAIVAFVDGCPPGPHWEAYEPARGRFLLGAGVLVDTDPSPLRVDPGDFKDTAKHHHGGLTDGAPRQRRADNDTRNPHTSDAGHKHVIQQDNHLPPYLGVVFCVVVK